MTASFLFIYPVSWHRCHFYWKADLHLLCVISSFRREADETWDVLLWVYYTACTSNSLPTFWDNLAFILDSLTLENIRPIGCPETSVMIYTLRNNPEERTYCDTALPCNGYNVPVDSPVLALRFVLWRFRVQTRCGGRLIWARTTSAHPHEFGSTERDGAWEEASDCRVNVLPKHHLLSKQQPSKLFHRRCSQRCYTNDKQTITRTVHCTSFHTLPMMMMHRSAACLAVQLLPQPRCHVTWLFVTVYWHSLCVCNYPGYPQPPTSHLQPEHVPNETCLVT